MAPLMARDVSVPLQDGWSLEAEVSDDGGWIVHSISLYHRDYGCVTVPWESMGVILYDKLRSMKSAVVEWCDGHFWEWDDDDRAAAREHEYEEREGK
ncbi:MAG: hypothetical protein C4523_02670 [Myxococcales bacterium]|jgi:hypothetical protein|nr:MAG: hypothetical protein C4523_02670 [Myxococcales bacterium]